jgi:HNH/ENDO VII superfamily nuclease
MSDEETEDKEHDSGVTVGVFCATRGTPPCDCGYNYQTVCKPSWAYLKYAQKYTETLREWATFAAEHGQKTPQRVLSRRRSYEAHHLLCVASVSKIVASKDDPEADIVEIVRQTNWCINHKDNLIALPMWGHTLRWYCSMVTGDIRQIALADGTVAPASGPPPFQNLPQHNYDHDLYIDEVDRELVEIVDQVSQNKRAHYHRKKQLRDELNKLVRSSRGKLRKRGARCSGTHKAWQQGMNQNGSDWYMPFSMADDGEVRKQTFPIPGRKTGIMGKINEMVAAFWGAAGG